MEGGALARQPAESRRHGGPTPDATVYALPRVTLAAGSRFGPYEIVAPIGAGGMGEVYQARDERLGRDVAIKILPAGVAAPALFARFQREARVCSSLSHPNIVTIHELDEVEGRPYIAMELVRGQSLRKLLEQGLSLQRKVRLAAQIADGLAAAHARGIVHRDLKPENVMVTEAGVAKILDFGIARLENEALAVTQGATDVQLTREGAVVGTVGYMSPEQARGENVDFRADQFSFGVMVYEMIRGAHPFMRSTAAATLGAILHDDPEPISPGTAVTSRLAIIVERCLAKEPGERYGSTADLAHDFRTLTDTRRAPRENGVRRVAWLLPVVAAVLVAGGFALTQYLDKERAGRPPAMHLAVPIDELFVFFGETAVPVEISPDGGTIILSASGGGRGGHLWDREGAHLWAHDLVRGTTTRLEGTENAYSPVWNDEGTQIAFFAEGKLKTLPLGGGPPRVVCNASPEGRAAWRGDTIVFAQITNAPAVWKVQAAGGEPTAIIPPREGRVPFWPEFLPDGRFLFLDIIQPEGEGTERTHELMVGSLDGAEPRRVAPGIDSRVTWSDTGHLLYVREGTLFAQSFDPEALAFQGEAVSLASRLHYFYSTGLAGFSVSRNGVLVWRTIRRRTELSWVDRRGSLLASVGRGRFEKGQLSGDGEEYVTALVDENRGTSSLWTWDVVRGNGVRLGFSSFDEKAPVRTPDGRLFFRSDESGPPDIFLRSPGEDRSLPFLRRAGVQEPLHVSPDGAWLLYAEYSRQTGGDLWITPMDDPEKARPFVITPANEWAARFSPDGEHVAYESDASGAAEIYVRPVADGGMPVRISNGGGSEVRWSGDGSEIFYLAADGAVMSVPIRRVGGTIRPGAPAILFRASSVLDFDPAAAGDRFLLRSSIDESDPQVRLLTDWRALLP